VISLEKREPKIINRPEESMIINTILEHLDMDNIIDLEEWGRTHEQNLCYEKAGIALFAIKIYTQDMNVIDWVIIEKDREIGERPTPEGSGVVYFTSLKEKPDGTLLSKDVLSERFRDVSVMFMGLAKIRDKYYTVKEKLKKAMKKKEAEIEKEREHTEMFAD